MNGAGLAAEMFFPLAHGPKFLAGNSRIFERPDRSRWRFSSERFPGDLPYSCLRRGENQPPMSDESANRALLVESPRGLKLPVSAS
jgi:hypothetical protein